MFYFIIEFTKQYKRKIAVFIIINNNAYYIYHRANFLVNEICNVANPSEENYNIKEDDFSTYCEAINIHSIRIKVWFYPEIIFKDFVLKICEDIKSNVDGLLIYSDLLDEKWVHKLACISDDIRQIQTLLNVNEGGSTLNLVNSYIWQLYFEATKIWELSEKYYKEHYEAYKIQHPRLRSGREELIFKVQVKSGQEKKSTL